MVGGCQHLFRTDKGFENKFGTVLKQNVTEHCHHKQENHGMVNYAADFQKVPFAVPPCYYYLCPGTKTKADHYHCQVENSSQRTCPQRHGTYAPQKGGVGNVDEVLRHTAKYYGVGNIPNPAVCYAGLHFEPANIMM